MRKVIEAPALHDLAPHRRQRLDKLALESCLREISELERASHNHKMDA